MFLRYRERKAAGLASIVIEDEKPKLKIKLWSRSTGLPDEDKVVELSLERLLKRKASLENELERLSEVIAEINGFQIRRQGERR
jgi:hypothetical protein